jgi:curved DNA-binding protein CbpA
MRILGKNYYEILGITKNASSTEIQFAYRTKIIEFHPDKHNQDQLALALSQDLSEIKEILLNSSKRFIYDQSLEKTNIVKIVEVEPKSRCVVCGKELDADWKTYCAFHYREYMQNKNG